MNIGKQSAHPIRVGVSDKAKRLLLEFDLEFQVSDDRYVAERCRLEAVLAKSIECALIDSGAGRVNYLEVRGNALIVYRESDGDVSV